MPPDPPSGPGNNVATGCVMEATVPHEDVGAGDETAGSGADGVTTFGFAATGATCTALACAFATCGVARS